MGAPICHYWNLCSLIFKQIRNHIRNKVPDLLLLSDIEYTSYAKSCRVSAQYTDRPFSRLHVKEIVGKKQRPFPAVDLHCFGKCISLNCNLSLTRINVDRQVGIFEAIMFWWSKKNTASRTWPRTVSQVSLLTLKRAE